MRHDALDYRGLLDKLRGIPLSSPDVHTDTLSTEELKLGKLAGLSHHSCFRPGGMGIVYEAKQESLGRRVALKVLPNRVMSDQRSIERFEREARVVANLHHTNIIAIFRIR
ncbi:MAG: hypothetical protein R3C05_28170 [Pirellulaceae bacterium]